MKRAARESKIGNVMSIVTELQLLGRCCKLTSGKARVTIL